MALSIRKGDRVSVIAGKNKGKKGKILKVNPAKSRVIVEGVNLLKKHTKPTKDNPKGGIIEKEAPIHISNVMLICPSCSKPTRLGSVMTKTGKKSRVCLRCEAEIGVKK